MATKYFEGYRGKFIIESAPPLRRLKATAETLAAFGSSAGDPDARGEPIVADKHAWLHDLREPAVYHLLEPTKSGALDHGAYASPAEAQAAADEILAGRAAT